MALLPALLLLLTTAPEASSLTGPNRDPFAGPSAVPVEEPCEVPGPHCVSWQRAKVTIVVTSPAGDVATLQAGKDTWTIREGDRLRNAVVVRIDPERRGVLLREPMPGTVAGFREIVLLTGEDEPIVREPMSVEPALAVPGR